MEERVIDLYDMFIDLYWNDISSNDKDWEIEGKLWSILNEIYFKYGYQDRVIFSLSLYGSQNYNMDNENSDIDCQCFFFPTAEEIIFNKSFQSTTINTKYGECVLKDIRQMFDELRKSSPNILEVLGTKYCIVNRDFQRLLSSIAAQLDTLARLNEYKLLKGYEGLYYRYTKDNLKETKNTKYYANALRIMEVIDTITTLPDWEYSMLLESADSEYYKWIKYGDFDKVFREDFYVNRCMEIEAGLKKYFDEHNAISVDWIKDIINNYQRKIMEKYLKLTF